VKGYIDEAETYRRTAQNLLEQWQFPESIRASQTCVELCLKAVLGKYGISVPHKHDVGAELAQASKRFPKSFQEKVAKFRLISLTLAMWREPSVYGLGQFPPDKAFGQAEAKLALQFAEEVYNACSPVRYDQEIY
jgi:HEPN domain-containing protein